MDKIILAFSGHRGTGKTLICDYLIKQYGFRKISFADTLRDLARSFFSFSDEDFYGETKEEPFRKYPWTPRDFLVKLGGFCRYWDEEFLTDTLDLEGKLVCIDDLRFEQEAKFLKEKGAKLIRLDRFKYLNVYKNELDDVSETDLDDFKFDFTVEKQNNTDKSSLYRTVSNYYKGLNG